LDLDYSILDRFDFSRPPVGVKFLYDKPDGLERLKAKRPFCMMLTEAHRGEAFYAGEEDHLCHGMFCLGGDIPPYYETGAVVAEVGQVADPRAGREVYRTLPRLPKGTVTYVAFAPLAKMSFDPDVMVFAGTIEQAEILLRASTYTNGKLWTAKTSVVLGCAWLYVHPFVSGEVNYMIMGINAGGMIAFKLLPVGVVLVSVPFQQLPGVLANLRQMPWEHPEMPPENVSEEFRELMNDLGDVERSRKTDAGDSHGRTNQGI
jgi:uncharacterized protein (DUF169 family)